LTDKLLLKTQFHQEKSLQQNEATNLWAFNSC
jgi:hypothetical protein